MRFSGGLKMLKTNNKGHLSFYHTSSITKSTRVIGRILPPSLLFPKVLQWQKIVKQTFLLQVILNKLLLAKMSVFCDIYLYFSGSKNAQNKNVSYLSYFFNSRQLILYDLPPKMALSTLKKYNLELWLSQFLKSGYFKGLKIP